MQSIVFRSLLLMALLGSSLRPVCAQSAPPPALQLAVEGQPMRTFTASELALLPRLTLTAPDKQGRPHQYEGVALHTVLATAGVPLKTHSEALTRAVLITGQDGYQAVLALPELIPDLAAQPVLLADRCDGQPLTVAQGPWQLIVPADRKPARWVRQVQRVAVVGVVGVR